MKINLARQVFLTFDVEGPKGREDFFPEKSVEALLRVLRLLKRFQLRGLFFITGTVTARVARFPEVTEMLKDHLVGYHSSSHSIKPRIFEYTDIEDYRKAVEKSLERETSSIDPQTGRVIGKGGILQLRRVFHNREIECFRAPFLCWSPPHLESLRKLGFKFDFSTNISDAPTQYRGLTFFPHATPVDTVSEKVASIADNQSRLFPKFLLQKILSEKVSVLLIHPSVSIPAASHADYAKSDPNAEVRLTERKSSVKSTVNFVALKMLLSELSLLERSNTIVVTPPPRASDFNLDARRICAEKLYTENALICKRLFDYKPTYMLPHFVKFFESTHETGKHKLIEE
jgi:hypothetical protein